MELSKNTILITGGGSGIGLALAKAFALHENTVIVCGRNSKKLEAMHNDNPAIVTLPCDIASDQDQQDLVENLTQKYPGLNVLINNAGIQHNYAFDDTQSHTALIEEEININFLAHAKLTDRFLPFLLTAVHSCSCECFLRFGGSSQAECAHLLRYKGRLAQLFKGIAISTGENASQSI